MKLVHISKHKRTEGQLGGVEKFASYLKRVFPQMELYSFTEDCSEASRYNGPDYEMALLLNKQLIAEGKVTQDTTVIVDGFWGLGLNGTPKCTINVAHGTYIGTAWVNEVFPFQDAATLLLWAEKQGQSYREADVVVAVAQRTQEELWTAYGIEAVKIINGIDLDIYRPDPDRRQSDLILHASGTYGRGRKQLELVEAVQATAKELRIEPLNVKSGIEKDEASRWQEGAVFLSPSLYEGCAFASLEAMACGCIPVAFRIGIFGETPSDVGIIIDDHHVLKYVQALKIALGDNSCFQPRRWVERNASFTQFADNWQRLLEGL